MSGLSGELSSATEPPVLLTPAKRKRTNIETSNQATVEEKSKLHETLRNLVDVLKKSDTDLRLLSCPLPVSPTKHRSKRAKVLSDKEDYASIQSRVISGRYNRLQEFLSDFEKAFTITLERRQSEADAGQTNLSSEITTADVASRVAAFKKLLNTLVQQAYATRPEIGTELSESDTDVHAGPASSNVDIRNDSLALTLFGNPANPKQLFSSLQKPTKVSLTPSEPKGEYVEIRNALCEADLPNGITVTKIPPCNPGSRSTKPVRTFGEVFAPRSTLPQLEPPRKTKSFFRSAAGSWIDLFDVATNLKAFPGERTNYCLTSLPSGQWLQYGGATSSPSYWMRKQKPLHQPEEGDGTYGAEKASLLPSDDASAIQSVYSSFAPSFDSSGAVLQVDSKDLVWWGRQGVRRLNKLLSISQCEESDGSMTALPEDAGMLNEEALEEIVSTFKAEDFADVSVQSERDKEAKDLDDILRDISDLLDTLASYQRIRNLEIPTACSKSGGSKGESSSESDSMDLFASEKEIYETLKSSLAAMISGLPPYAVAKLDGAQMAELSISQKIRVDNADYQGTMEKDDFTLQQERAAAIGPMASASRASTPRSVGYNQRVYHPGARLQHTQSDFQTSQAYYGGRQSSMSSAYTAVHHQPYAGTRPSTTPSQRTSYVAGYSATLQYNQGSTASGLQRPITNGYSSYAAQLGVPHTQASPPPYTPRPTTYNAPFGTGRSMSPQKQYGVPTPTPAAGHSVR